MSFRPLTGIPFLNAVLVLVAVLIVCDGFRPLTGIPFLNYWPKKFKRFYDEKFPSPYGDSVP